MTQSKDTGFEAQPYYGICTFGRQPHTRDLDGVDVAIVGVPYDGSTSYRSGARFGPRAIREQSLLLWGYNNALDVAPFKAQKVIDYGDVDVVPPGCARHTRRHQCGSGQHREGRREGDRARRRSLDRAAAAACAQSQVRPAGRDPLRRAPGHVGHRVRRAEVQPRHALPPRHRRKLIDTSAYIQIGIRGPTSGKQDYEDALALGARMITIDDAMRMGLGGILGEIRCACRISQSI